MQLLVVTNGFRVRLLRNETIAGYFAHCYAELLEELVTIMEAVTSDASQF